MQLSEVTFRQVVESTPLISIDLIIKNTQGEVLLGQRVNRPAQGFWFVPGGRIRKNETLADAFRRLTEGELGQALSIESARYLGLYEHFYPDSVFGETPSTHYVVNAFEVACDISLEALPDQQHNAYRWMGVEELLASDEVHTHSKWYFTEGQGYGN